MAKAIDIRIEYPSVGATYHRLEYAVYEYSEYPRHSVLAGQERRVFYEAFPTLEEARAKYPSAEVCIEGSGYREPDLSHLPDDEDASPWHPSPDCPCNICRAGSASREEQNGRYIDSGPGAWDDRDSEG